VQICIWPSWCHCQSLSLATVNSDWFYLPGFTFLVPAHLGSPGQSPGDCKMVIVVSTDRLTWIIMYIAIQCKSEWQATQQDTACSLCRGDVHSSSEVGSWAAVDTANTGISHSCVHQVFQLDSLSVLLPFLRTSDVPPWLSISCSNSEVNNTSHLNSN